MASKRRIITFALGILLAGCTLVAGMFVPSAYAVNFTGQEFSNGTGGFACLCSGNNCVPCLPTD
jgi:hypothetical protein